MKLEDFGYNNKIETLKKENNLEAFEIGRVILEHKERYIVTTVQGEYEAEITGNLRYTANTREDFPAVGDWVALVIYDSYNSIIHKVLPRSSMLARQAVGQSGDIQIIATNIDYAFIVQAVDRDFNINRIERYLTISNTSNIQPLIILNKIDLIDKLSLNTLMDNLKKRINAVPIFAISSISKQGVEQLKEIISKGKTYCLLGSSGVGKSTLVNILTNTSLMKTKNISEHSKKGQHTTTHRELILLDNGGIIIDNPGMREIGIASGSYGLEKTFETIYEYSKQCRFKDCTHTIEIGCAVIAAVDIGEIDQFSYENYLKMQKEKDHFESTVAEKRKKDKNFGKMVKQFKNLKKSSKF